MEIAPQCGYYQNDGVHFNPADGSKAFGKTSLSSLQGGKQNSAKIQFGQDTFEVQLC